ncbi:hypothetical protein FDF74_06905 [Clostridium niameyense]|uniref:Lipoprotein n=1 Tax=Clostridium niameyense TaxID=1622073 RepID=A0A6M0RB97_9CLOT|nr:hypothetical protein [Clostridium niameyense]NEZ46940.1 hypothetical protein [Clostridium niameyense]
MSTFKFVGKLALVSLLITSSCKNYMHYNEYNYQKSVDVMQNNIEEDNKSHKQKRVKLRPEKEVYNLNIKKL